MKTQDSENEKSVFLLDLLISIFKFRLLVTNNESRALIVDEMDNIRLHYLNINDTNHYLDANLVKDALDACILFRNANNIKANIFDKLAAEVYQFLEQKFKEFKETGQFDNIKNELNEETNIRCKLTNFGLIRN